MVVGDVQTSPTPNCSSPYAHPLGVKSGDGRACSQSWVMFSDTHGRDWNYSRTLILPGDEVSNPASLSNGSVLLNVRGHDLGKYDGGDPNKALRWTARSDDGGQTWPSGRRHLRPLLNASSHRPMHFGGDCFGDMALLPAHRLPAATHPWVGAGQEVLVMGTIHHVGSSHGISGRSDYRLHRSTDGGESWELLAMVYAGSASYSGLVGLNASHVGVAYNAGSERASSMSCGAVTKYVVVCARCPGLQTI